MSMSDGRILSKEQCADIVKRVAGFSRGGGETSVSIQSTWNGELRWARNRTSLASDRRNILVIVKRRIKQKNGDAFTNQIDDVSLEAAVRSAERVALREPRREPTDLGIDLPVFEYPVPTIWSNATFDVTAETRGSLAQMLTQDAETRSMLSAGYLEMRAAAFAEAGSGNDTYQGMAAHPKPATPQPLETEMQYGALTQGQCSMTVRHPKGTGSGWAGLSSFDWNTIDGPVLARRALEKCLSSLNPVRIEPGRYTVVLDPQAVGDLVDLLMPPTEGTSPFDRGDAERGRGPFVLGPDPMLGIVRTKLGLKVIDDRITIEHNYTDPQLGVVPGLGGQPITWIEKGVLQTLNYDRQYSAPNLNETRGAFMRPSYRMSGGTATIEEMIASTQRGLLVSRFSNLNVLDGGSLLATGVTRDGLWLIENGKISKAVNNMRITESPLFVLNQVEQLGVPVPIFRPEKYVLPRLTPAIVPPLKARDFSFTSTIDAV